MAEKLFKLQVISIYFENFSKRVLPSCCKWSYLSLYTILFEEKRFSFFSKVPCLELYNENTEKYRKYKDVHGGKHSVGKSAQNDCIFLKNGLAKVEQYRLLPSYGTLTSLWLLPTFEQLSQKR